MNDRICKFAELSMETVDVSGKLGIPGTERVFNKEKFAELIIRECANVVFTKMGPKSALNVLDHFGIEE